jgi:hypothetical protein
VPLGAAGQAHERERVAEVVAVHHVQRHVQRQQRPQRLRADHVAAMNGLLRARGLARTQRSEQRVGPVVAVRNDADLHRASNAAFGPVGFTSPT